MKTTFACLALLCIAATAGAQQFTDGNGATYQLTKQCDGFGHCQMVWVQVSAPQAAPAAAGHKPMPKTPEQTKEPPIAAPAVAVEVEARFPLAREAAGRGRKLIHRLLHPFHRARQALGAAVCACGCKLAGCDCGK